MGRYLDGRDNLQKINVLTKTMKEERSLSNINITFVNNLLSHFSLNGNFYFNNIFFSLFNSVELAFIINLKL